MNIFKKILSVMFAIVISLSCFGILANAAGESYLSFSYNYTDESKKFEGYFILSGCTSAAYGEINIPSTHTELVRLDGVEKIVTRPVTAISQSAFKDIEGITKVTVPASVTSVGNSAFENCYQLGEIVFEGSDCTIGIAAFRYCSSLKKIVLPSNLKTIPLEGFAACTALEEIEIPSTVTSIGKEAFKKCSALKSVSIPASVTSIGLNAFLNCGMVEEYTVKSGNKNYKAVGGVLFDIGGETLIQYPNGKAATQYTVPAGVKTIADSAFGSNTKLTKVTLPSGLTTISAYAFNLCSALSEINIPSSVTEIGPQAFGGCKNLKAVTLPAGIQSWSGAFYNSGIETAVLSDGIEFIDEKAFEKCTALKSVTVPSSVEEIRIGAFDGCSALETLVIPESVTAIGTNAFRDCDNLTLTVKHGSFAHTYAIENGIDFEATDVPVEKEIDSVEIKTLPAKLAYTAGEKINTSGMVLTVNYSDGTQATVTSGFELDTNYATGTGTKTVKVTYKGKSDTFEITVSAPVEKTVVGMSISKFPDKTDYYYKQSLSTSGMKLLVEYDDGTTETVTKGYEVPATTFKTIGSHKITVTYKGFTDEFSVNVTYAWWQMLIRILLLGFLWY